MPLLDYHTPSPATAHAVGWPLFLLSFILAWGISLLLFGFIESAYHSTVTGHHGDGTVFRFAARSFVPAIIGLVLLRMILGCESVGLRWACGIGVGSALLGFVYVYVFW